MSDVPVSEAAIGHPDMCSVCKRHVLSCAKRMGRVGDTGRA